MIIKQQNRIKDKGKKDNSAHTIFYNYYDTIVKIIMSFLLKLH